MIPESTEFSQWKLQVRAPHPLPIETNPGKKKKAPTKKPTVY